MFNEIIIKVCIVLFCQVETHGAHEAGDGIDTFVKMHGQARYVVLDTGGEISIAREDRCEQRVSDDSGMIAGINNYLSVGNDGDETTQGFHQLSQVDAVSISVLAILQLFSCQW